MIVLEPKARLVNEGIFPDPLAARPIDGFPFVQLNTAPKEPLNEIALNEPPVHTVWSEIVLTDGLIPTENDKANNQFWRFYL